MKILVTGGDGFIGSAVIRHIIESTQDEVVSLDKLTYASNLESLTEVKDSSRHTFEQVDICERSEVDRALSQHRPIESEPLISEKDNNAPKFSSAVTFK